MGLNLKTIIDNDIMVVEKGNKWPGVCYICNEKSDYSISLKHGNLQHSMLYCDKHYHEFINSISKLKVEGLRCNRGPQGYLPNGSGIKRRNSCEGCSKFDGFSFCHEHQTNTDINSLCCKYDSCVRD